ncbi:T9SS type A sorting domain-containing protein, partial [bacterium]|nr:T9SS type A sorting domain-containing protein [bacterium]
DLLGGPLTLDLPTNVSSTPGWVEIVSSTPISFPVTVNKITAEVKLNQYATGTVWVDDFFIRPTTEGDWVGDFFNANVDVPDGWFYWWNNFSTGSPDWAPLAKIADWAVPVFAGQTQDEARSGVSSLKMRKDAAGDELVVCSEHVTFVNDGTPLVFSAWGKTDLPDGMAALANSDPSAGVFFTVTWHDGTAGADAWGEVGGSDGNFNLAGDQSDWTQYTAVLTPPDNATQFSLRVRYAHNFIGTTYWDDFSVMRSSPLATENEYDNIVSTPKEFRLLDAYPNPFNPQVNIVFEMPKEGNVKLMIYDISGHLVSTLINNNTLDVGKHLIQWNALTNSGIQVPTGIYLVRLELDGLETKLAKITYMK